VSDRGRTDGPDGAKENYEHIEGGNRVRLYSVRKPKARSWENKEITWSWPAAVAAAATNKEQPARKEIRKRTRKSNKKISPNQKTKGKLETDCVCGRGEKEKRRRRIKELLLLLSIVILRTVLAISTHLIKKASALEECQWPAAAGRSYVHLEIVVH
jgi:hypothetical protein